MKRGLFVVYWINLFGATLEHSRHRTRAAAIKEATSLRRSLDHGLSRMLGYKPKTFVRHV